MEKGSNFFEGRKSDSGDSESEFDTDLEEGDKGLRERLKVGDVHVESLLSIAAKAPNTVQIDIVIDGEDETGESEFESEGDEDKDTNDEGVISPESLQKRKCLR
ncbi:hypothetical protein U1Q18_037772 [Sarracenia purpurea var. burkii]